MRWYSLPSFLSFFFLLFLSSQKSSFPGLEWKNARRCVRLVDCFPIACITIARRFTTSLSSPLPFLSTAFFLRLQQRRSCCQFPEGRRELRERAAVSRRIATAILFSAYVDLRTIPIPRSVNGECTAHPRILFSGYTWISIQEYCGVFYLKWN